MFDRCKATSSSEEVIKVDPLKGWTSLNIISSSSISAPTGMLIVTFLDDFQRLR